MASIFDVFNMLGGQQGGGEVEAGTGNVAQPQQGLGMWRNIEPQQLMQMGQGMMQQGQPQQQPSPLPFAGGPVNVGGGAYSQQFNQLQTPMPQGGGYQPQATSVAKQNEIEQLRRQLDQMRGGMSQQQMDQRYMRNWHNPGR